MNVFKKGPTRIRVAPGRARHIRRGTRAMTRPRPSSRGGKTRSRRRIRRTLHGMNSCLTRIAGRVNIRAGVRIAIRHHSIFCGFDASRRKLLVNGRNGALGSLRLLTRGCFSGLDFGHLGVVLSITSCHRHQARALGCLTGGITCSTVSRQQHVRLSPVPTCREGIVRSTLTSGSGIGACSENTRPEQCIIVRPTESEEWSGWN